MTKISLIFWAHFKEIIVKLTLEEFQLFFNERGTNLRFFDVFIVNFNAFLTIFSFKGDQKSLING
jgi:hypothetical protein